MPCCMAAPDYVPVSPTERPRLPWESPPHVPEAWTLDRPAEVAEGRQPKGPRLGYPGPDIGYALTLAELLRPKIRVTPGVLVDDAMVGCVGMAMRRAAGYGRAPVMHDLRLSFTIWGFLDDLPPTDLVEFRAPAVPGRRPRLRDRPGHRGPHPRVDPAAHPARGGGVVPGSLAGAGRGLIRRRGAPALTVAATVWWAAPEGASAGPAVAAPAREPRGRVAPAS